MTEKKSSFNRTFILQSTRNSQLTVSKKGLHFTPYRMQLRLLALISTVAFAFPICLAEEGPAKSSSELASRYRDRIIASFVGGMKGKKTRIVSQDGQSYKDVTVLSHDATTITIDHSEGQTTLDITTAPKRWITGFCLLSPAEAKLLKEPTKRSKKTRRTKTLKNKEWDYEPGDKDFSQVTIFTGDQGTGTGFVCKADDHFWIYTAAHVVSGNKKITIKDPNGKEYRNFDLMQTAKGIDLMRLRMTDEVDSALIAATPSDDIGSGDFIAALGNGGGAGVLSAEKGEIVGVSADFYEVSADIIPGNSGGPIIELNTGKVVGVATHLTQAKEDVWTAGTRFTKVRRFCARLDKKHVWIEQSIGSFIQEGTSITEYDNITRLGYALASYTATRRGLRLHDSISNETVAFIRNVIDENSSLNVVKSLKKMNRNLSRRGDKMSVTDLKAQMVSVLRQAQNLANLTAKDLKLPVKSHFHTKEIEQSLKWRKGALENLKTRIADLRP